MLVVYHISSTMQVGPTPNGRAHSLYAKTYKNAAGARRACAKFNSQEPLINWDRCRRTEAHGPGSYGWCSVGHYRERVVRMVERTNFMSGKKFMEPSNTPGFCSPSSETYWSS